MRAQYTIKRRAKLFDRPAALVIDDVGSKFDGKAVQIFNRVVKQQQFAFGVQPGFLS